MRDEFEMKDLRRRADRLAVTLGQATEDTANYGCVYHRDDIHGRDTYIYYNTACHAGLGSGKNAMQTRNPDMIVSAIWNAPEKGGSVRPKWFDSLGKRYYTFLMGESIYAPIFDKQTIDVVMKHRAFIVTPHVPDLLLFGGLCATRAMWEHTDHIIIWDILVKGGINPGIALALCKSMKIKNYPYKSKVSKAAYEKSPEELDITSIEVISGESWHWPLPVACFDVRKLRRYGGTYDDVKGLYKHCLTYHKTSTYGKCNAMYSTEDENNMVATISRLLKNMSERKVDGKQVTDIKDYRGYPRSFTSATLTVKGAIILAQYLTKDANKF